MGEGGGENSPFPLLLKWESEALFLCLKLEKQSRSISPPPHTGCYRCGDSGRRQVQRLVPSGLWSSDGVVRWESLSPTLCPDPPVSEGSEKPASVGAPSAVALTTPLLAQSHTFRSLQTALLLPLSHLPVTMGTASRAGRGVCCLQT